MTRTQLREALKTKTPGPSETLPDCVAEQAVPLSNGFNRTAWRVGSFVVKAACSCEDYVDMRDRVRGQNESRFRVAPTVTVNGWHIQLFYRAPPPALRTMDTVCWMGSITWADIHWDNLGLDRRNRFVAFDW